MDEILIRLLRSPIGVRVAQMGFADSLVHILPHDHGFRPLCGDAQRGQPNVMHTFFVYA